MGTLCLSRVLLLQRGVVRGGLLIDKDGIDQPCRVDTRPYGRVLLIFSMY